jgi:membrane-associated protease RseP (regulator of RpoE activity)
MALLHIALQEGFTGDDVVVRVQGEEVFRKEDVTTRLQIGYADSFEVRVEGEEVKIEVLLPLKNLSETIILQVPPTEYLGLSIYEGRLITEPPVSPNVVVRMTVCPLAN